MNTLCNYGYYIHKKQTLNTIEIQVKHNFVLKQIKTENNTSIQQVV